MLVVPGVAPEPPAIQSVASRYPRNVTTRASDGVGHKYNELFQILKFVGVPVTNEPAYCPCANWCEIGINIHDECSAPSTKFNVESIDANV